MPLSVQRPQHSMFSQHHTRTNKPAEKQPDQKTTSFYDFLRFYPLQSGGERHSQKQPGSAKPVSPLTPSRANPLPSNRPTNPLPPQQRQNPLQQFTNPRQQPPHPPMQHMPSGQMPHHTPQHPFQQPHIPSAIFPNQTQQQHPTPPPQNRQQAQVQAQASAPPTPQNAAEQFRRMNKNLPDGVKYEPLDDETMRILKMAQLSAQGAPNTPQSAPQIKEVPPSPSIPVIPPEIAKSIETLTQDEYNAQVFYTGISQNVSNEATKKSLTELAKDCEARHKKYTQMLKMHFDIEFTPAEKEINTSLPFSNAISLALSEESKTLSTLCSLLGQVEGTPMERQIERTIIKKILGQQVLFSFYITK